VVHQLALHSIPAEAVQEEILRLRKAPKAAVGLTVSALKSRNAGAVGAASAFGCSLGREHVSVPGATYS
jgi:hypothetical protein